MALNQKLAHTYAHELTRSEKKAKQAKISKFEPHLRRAFAKADNPKKIARFLADPAQKKYIVDTSRNGHLARIFDGRMPHTDFLMEHLENSPSYHEFRESLTEKGIEIADVSVVDRASFETLVPPDSILMPDVISPCIHFDLRPSQALAEAVSIRQEEQRRKETDRRLTPSPIIAVHGEGGSIPKPQL